MSVTGNMAVKNATFGTGVEILNRPPYEGVPITLDDEAFSDSDVVKAGTLIKKNGTVDDSGAEPFGILLSDVYKDRPQGTVLKKAYVNLKRIKESITEGTYETMYSDVEALKTKLPRIEFEEEPSGE